jgi:ribonuclease HI
MIHTDGGARGNPGPAAVGVVIEEVMGEAQSQTAGRATKPKVIARFGKKIGEATNNIAEYTAVTEALEEVRGQLSKIKSERGSLEIQFYLDSTLVVNQLNGVFRVKEAHLRELLMRVRALEAEVGGYITYSVVPREHNQDADVLVNQALDG